MEAACGGRSHGETMRPRRPQSGHRGIIARWRHEGGDPAHADAVALSLSRAVEHALQVGTRCGGRSEPYTVRSLRRLPTGAELLRVSRPLDAFEAGVLLMQLRADPTVLYAQLDTFAHRRRPPADARYAGIQPPPAQAGAIPAASSRRVFEWMIGAVF